MSDWQNRYQRLLFDRPHPKVLRVTMNRPEKYNATDAIMHRELVDVWRDIDGDDTVNCVIIQGAGGKVFRPAATSTSSRRTLRTTTRCSVRGRRRATSSTT